MVVSGGTGAGKTTLLNALAAELPDRERVITVEDAAELQLPGSHVVRLEARPATPDGLGGVTIRDLVRNALRMRPDRIVVGEVRGSEALDMVQAMNTGHEGSLTTCHANSPLDALRRLETMLLCSEAAMPLGAVRDHVSSALDLIVQVARLDHGRRGIVAVAEICPTGAEPMESADPRRPSAGCDHSRSAPLEQQDPLLLTRLGAAHDVAAARSRGTAGNIVRRLSGRNTRLQATTVDEQLAHALSAAGVETTPLLVRRVRQASSALIPLALLTSTGAAVVVGGLVVVAVVSPGPRWMLRALQRRAQTRRDRALPAVLEHIAAAVRAGGTITVALEGTAARAEGLLGDEMAEVALLVEAGVPVAAAVDRWRQRAASPSVDMASTALQLGNEAGGEVARLLDAVAASLRERREIEVEAAALATQARASASVLAAAPIAFAFLAAAADPEAGAFLLSTRAGLACLAAGIGLLAAGALWMARIVRVSI